MKPTIEDIEKQARDLWGEEAWIQVIQAQVTVGVRLGEDPRLLLARSASDEGAALSVLAKAIQENRKVWELLAWRRLHQSRCGDDLNSGDGPDTVFLIREQTRRIAEMEAGVDQK